MVTFSDVGSLLVSFSHENLVISRSTMCCPTRRNVFFLSFAALCHGMQANPQDDTKQIGEIKGNSRQILLSEMGLSGMEVLVEKLLP